MSFDGYVSYEKSYRARMGCQYPQAGYTSRLNRSPLSTQPTVTSRA